MNLKLAAYSEIWFALTIFGKAAHAFFEKFCKKNLAPSSPLLCRACVFDEVSDSFAFLAGTWVNLNLVAYSGR